MKNNSIFYLIIGVLLVATKIILFNEEFLVFLCFVSFIFIIKENFIEKIKTNLNEKIKKNELILVDLLNTLQIQLNKKILFNKNIKKLIFLFDNLKKYYLNLSKIFNAKVLNYYRVETKISLINKLDLFSEFERINSKLIFSMLIEKIKKIVSTNLFLKHKLNINQIKTLNKINLYGYIKNV